MKVITLGSERVKPENTALDPGENDYNNNK